MFTFASVPMLTALECGHYTGPHIRNIKAVFNQPCLEMPYPWRGPARAHVPRTAGDKCAHERGDPMPRRQNFNHESLCTPSRLNTTGRLCATRQAEESPISPVECPRKASRPKGKRAAGGTFTSSCGIAREPGAAARGRVVESAKPSAMRRVHSGEGPQPHHARTDIVHSVNRR